MPAFIDKKTLPRRMLREKLTFHEFRSSITKINSIFAMNIWIAFYGISLFVLWRREEDVEAAEMKSENKGSLKKSLSALFSWKITFERRGRREEVSWEIPGKGKLMNEILEIQRKCFGRWALLHLNEESIPCWASNISLHQRNRFGVLFILWAEFLLIFLDGEKECSLLLNFSCTERNLIAYPPSSSNYLLRLARNCKEK